MAAGAPGRSPAAGADSLARVWLIGMMGAGKSTVGRALAARAGWAVVDTDNLIEQRAGRSVAELFSEVGEGQFRRQESELVAELAGVAGPVVVSVGGGAVLWEANRATMRRSGTVVWLRATPEVLARRLGRGDGRPLLSRTGGRQDLLGRIEVLAAERDPLYRQAAHLVVDVGQTSAHDVARRAYEVLSKGVEGNC